MTLPTTTQEAARTALCTAIVALTGYSRPGQVSVGNTDRLRIARSSAGANVPLIAVDIVGDVGVGFPGERVASSILTVYQARQATVIIRGVGDGVDIAMRTLSTLLWSHAPASLALRAAGVSVQATRQVIDVSARLAQATEPRYDLTVLIGYVSQLSSTPVAGATRLVVEVSAEGALTVSDLVVAEYPESPP